MGPSVGRHPLASLRRFAISRHFFGGLAKLAQAGGGEMVGGGGGLYLVIIWKEAALRPRANFWARAGHGLGRRSWPEVAATSARSCRDLCPKLPRPLPEVAATLSV